MSPLVVLEDDVILADTWQLHLKKLLDRGANMLLMGWNLDSMLRAEFSEGEEMISLFEPAYPNQNALHTIVNSDDKRVRKKLRYTFGLPGYWVQPAMARLLLNKIEKLETLSLKLGRGFPR